MCAGQKIACPPLTLKVIDDHVSHLRVKHLT